MAYTITKQGLNGVLYLYRDAVSNRHWIVKREALASPALFTSEAVAQAAFPKVKIFDHSETDIFSTVVKDSPVQEWKVLSWVQDSERRRVSPARVVQHGTETTGLNVCYLQMFGVASGDILYSAGAEGSFRDAEKVEDAAFAIMPMKLDPPFPA